MKEDLTQADTHFAFGRNWASYAEGITEAEIREAVNDLKRLVDTTEGKRFLDIGCGSGLHALAALRLGASEVLSVDIDDDSVKTAEAVLSRFAGTSNWQVEKISVFDLDPAIHGEYDIVYSWGVLHHTGNMERAIHKAAAMVAPRGLFAFALYRRIWMDAFWRKEKRWYAKSSPSIQNRARGIYIGLFRLGLRLTGRNFTDYVADYRKHRGMEYYHDVHDWMGGWPYESILPTEVEDIMRTLGFEAERCLIHKGRLFGRDVGVFGSGCDEYVYRRVNGGCAV